MEYINNGKSNRHAGEIKSNGSSNGTPLNVHAWPLLPVWAAMMEIPGLLTVAVVLLAVVWAFSKYIAHRRPSMNGLRQKVKADGEQATPDAVKHAQLDALDNLPGQIVEFQVRGERREIAGRVLK
jgi:hypothetical protein